ncbi:MAG: lasso RiPP family leader peptide-containing protein [Anaerolineae bacterium]
MKSKTARTKKTTYRPPRLVVYGDLRRLTMAKGGTSGDGGGKPKTKSTPPNA